MGGVLSKGGGLSALERRKVALWMKAIDVFKLLIDTLVSVEVTEDYILGTKLWGARATCFCDIVATLAGPRAVRPVVALALGRLGVRGLLQCPSLASRHPCCPSTTAALRTALRSCRVLPTRRGLVAGPR